MLNRLVATARVSPAEEQAEDREQAFWTPQIVLDGFGRAAPAEDLSPIAAGDMAGGPAPGRPAGIYAAGDRSRALNAGGDFTLATWPGATVEAAAELPGRDLKGWLLAAAALLLALDAIGSAFVARGTRARAMPAAAILLAVLLALPGGQARAQQDQPDPDLVRAANEVALAYVVTGDQELDQTSYEGLTGLSLALRQRTSVEPGEPVAIDLDTDDLSVLTFLYWPISAGQTPPSPQAYLRLNHYPRSGGMILFDTRDGDVAGLGGPDLGQTLRNLAGPLAGQPGLGRSAARRGRGRRGRAVPATERWRQPGGHRRQFLGRGLGGRRERLSGLSRRARLGGGTPARDGLSFRHQPDHVCADRELHARDRVLLARGA